MTNKSALHCGTQVVHPESEESAERRNQIDKANPLPRHGYEVRKKPGDCDIHKSTEDEYDRTEKL
jgi:hypothetical protein